MMDLGGEHVLDDFPHIFATSKGGYATDDPDKPGDSMKPLFDLMLEAIPGPEIEAERAAANARHESRLVRLRGPHRRRPHLFRHDQARPANRADAGRRQSRST